MNPEKALDIDTLVAFWFSPETEKRWFNSTPAFDHALRERYEIPCRQAQHGELDDWCNSPRGCLALVILLDQIPLNIYRKQPQSFAGESKSREIAALAIDQGFDQQLTGKQKAFLYMPFMHSENLADQHRSVALFEVAGLKDNLRFAEHHRDIVRRFGRFPHRNAILGRDNTAEEQTYLQSKEAFLG